MMTKRYYWLKLNENFFEDDTMRYLEEQDNGKDYIIFYLKLCLKSLSDEGLLVRYVGEKLIPYDVQALARLTNTKADTVAVAMKLFLEIGLIQQYDSGEIFINQINELIGTETDSAKRMRKKRLLTSQKQLPSHCAHNVHRSDTEIEIEIEKDIDIEKEQDKEQGGSGRRVFQKYEELGFGILNPNKAEQLIDWINTFDEDVVIKALITADNQNKANMNYVNGILRNWKNKGLRTVEEIETDDMQFHKNHKGGTGDDKPKLSEDVIKEYEERFGF